MRGTPRRDADAISEDELSLRRAVLTRFHDVSGYSTTISAADFQAVMESFGLAFGDEQTDRIMLLCRIDAAGQVCAWPPCPCVGVHECGCRALASVLLLS